MGRYHRLFTQYIYNLHAGLAARITEEQKGHLRLHIVEVRHLTPSVSKPEISRLGSDPVQGAQTRFALILASESIRKPLIRSISRYKMVIHILIPHRGIRIIVIFLEQVDKGLEHLRSSILPLAGKCPVIEITHSLGPYAMTGIFHDGSPVSELLLHITPTHSTDQQRVRRIVPGKVSYAIPIVHSHVFQSLLLTGDHARQLQIGKRQSRKLLCLLFPAARRKQQNRQYECNFNSHVHTFLQQPERC